MVFVVLFKPIEAQNLSKFGDYFFLSKTIFTFCHSSEVNCRFRAVSRKGLCLCLCLCLYFCCCFSLSKSGDFSLFLCHFASKIATVVITLCVCVFFSFCCNNIFLFLCAFLLRLFSLSLFLTLCISKVCFSSLFSFLFSISTSLFVNLLFFRFCFPFPHLFVNLLFFRFCFPFPHLCHKHEQIPSLVTIRN
jgi:hypothetical protein